MFIKPMLLGSLIVYFLYYAAHLSVFTKYLTLFALVASLTGDTLLLFVSTSENYFLLGLIAFLTAHIAYTIVFFKRRSTKKPSLFVTLGLIVYALLFVLFIKNSLGAFLIPVMAYVVIITSMAISAHYRKHGVVRLSYNWVMIGALCFVVSDSLLAINKFYTELPYEHVLIMLTYAAAQYAIVRGLLYQKNE